MFSGFDIIIPVLVVLVLLVIFTGIKTIPQATTTRSNASAAIPAR